MTIDVCSLVLILAVPAAFCKEILQSKDDRIFAEYVYFLSIQCDFSNCFICRICYEDSSVVGAF